MEKSVVVIGSLNYDIITKIPRMIVVGETLAATDASFACGGKGANQAAQCAKLGIDTYMMGCVGTDSMGDALLKNSQKHGVKTDYIRRVSTVSGMSTALSLQDGSVCATIIRGANFEVSTEDIDAADDLIANAAFVILQLELPLPVVEYAIKRAHAHGCKIILNAAPAEMISEIALSLCDIVVVNEIEAGTYVNKPITDVASAKAHIKLMTDRFENMWVFTLGKAGAVSCDGGEPIEIPIYDLPAVESTGAGDSFVGGLCYALMQGKNLADACWFASCCSAITVQNVGGQDSMPTLSEVNKLYNEN